MNMPGIRTICAALIILAAACPVVAVSESRNLTEINRGALSAKVDELQRSELVRIVRGRLSPNPIIFPFHTTYQTILQDQNLLISNHSETFSNTLKRLEKVYSDYPAGYGASAAAHAYFGADLIRLYDLSEPLSKAKSLMEVSQALNYSTYGMEALPIRAALALNASKWLSENPIGDEPSAEIKSRLDLLMRKWTPAADVFQLDAELRSLSAEYAKIFLDIAEERHKHK
jgi:hypothetical protein